MKTYRRFLVVFIVLLAVYIVAEMNRAKPLNWKVSLSAEDKNPYGGYVLFHSLPDLFPDASIQSFHLPVYNQLNDSRDSNTAYLLLDPNLDMSEVDVDEMLNYVVSGNYVFLSSFEVSKRVEDSLHIQTKRRLTFKDNDSVRINFVNPLLHAPADYRFNRFTIDEYMNRFDSVHAVVLGTNQFKDPNFIKIPYGSGAFFIHANPLCFTNYFMLSHNNADYTSTALSYLPQGIKKIYWDEYYKSGPLGSTSPMRFILTDPHLKWAFRISCIALLLFVIFEMKRRQRIIPIMPPLRNNTLDFVKTVGSVYFNKHDNSNIAIKKVQYLLEYIRSHFYLQTNNLNEDFEQSLSKKSGLDVLEIKDLIHTVQYVLDNGSVNDIFLLQLNSSIDSFYKKIK